MESAKLRSIPKKTSERYFLCEICRSLFKRFRRCEYLKLDGKGCNCVNEDDEGVSNECEGFYQDSSSQTELMHAPPSTSQGLVYELSDSPAYMHASQILDLSPRNFLFARDNLPKDQEYREIRNPYVLVINIVNFIKDPRPRNGAKHDQDNVERFVREAGFSNVLMHFDLDKQGMLKILEETRKNADLVKNDSFICIIMSHGNEEGILCRDHKTISVETIMEKFQGNNDACPQLATKPKLFFVQACRGEIDDKGYFAPRGPKEVYPDTSDNNEMPVKLPSDADFLIAYSTTKGTISHRRFTVDRRYAETHKESLGSWFISCLVQVLCENSHKEDLMTMLTRVNRAMCEFYTEGEVERDSTLCIDLW